MTICGCQGEDKDDSPSPTRQLQRVYNRGRFDGLRMAGIDDPGGFMRARKLAEAEASLNATGHKVLEAVPFGEPWPLHRIHAVLADKGCQIGLSYVEGQIRTAMDHGLVRETAHNTFIRVEYKEPRVVQLPPRTIETAQAASAPASKPAESPDPLVVLANISSNLRAFADTIDEQTLAFAEKLQRVQTEGAKLNQLRALLASLNEGDTK